MYSVMHKDSGVTRFLVCQIYSMEGSKYIKIRSPFQVGDRQTVWIQHRDALFQNESPLKVQCVHFFFFFF